MDIKDRQILNALQADGRLTNQQLSEQVNLSPSPCLRRLRNLEESGIIKGYTAIIDENAYGLPITAFVQIRLERHTEEVVQAFEKKILDAENILECYVMTGDSDYLLRVLVDSLESYEQFVRQRLHSIKGIAAIHTSFAYGRVKHATRFPSVE